MSDTTIKKCPVCLNDEKLIRHYDKVMPTHLLSTGQQIPLFIACSDCHAFEIGRRPSWPMNRIILRIGFSVVTAQNTPYLGEEGEAALIKEARGLIAIPKIAGYLAMVDENPDDNAPYAILLDELDDGEDRTLSEQFPVRFPRTWNILRMRRARAQEKFE